MEDWHRTFRHRMRDFEHRIPMEHGALPVSIKVRVATGCFHREHSPRAYEFIDQHLMDIPETEGFLFEEHESGPELLVYVAAATAGISLAKSIMDLIIAIIKARSEGIKKGDYPQAPLELIVRRTQKDGQFVEETVLRIGHQETVTAEAIEERLKETLTSLVKKDNENS